MKKFIKIRQRDGFTIVELLIVIVVIAILAAITIVAYNGIQSRARDSERLSEMQHIEKAIALYFIDNGGYPNCSGGTYTPGGTVNACNLSNLAAALTPKYLRTIPTDPKNSGQDIYQYAFGYKKTGATTYTGDGSNNYITGMHLETVSGNLNNGWVMPAYYNHLGGSSN